MKFIKKVIRVSSENSRKNALLIAGERASYSLLGAINLIIITRALGITEFGKYSLIMAIYAVVAPTVAIGLRDVLTKLIADKGEIGRRELLISAIFTQIVWSLPVILTAIIAATIYFPNLSIVILSIFLSVSTFKAADALKFYLIYIGQPIRSMKVEIPILLFGVVARLIFGVSGYGLLSFAIISLLEAMLIAAALFVVTREKLKYNMTVRLPKFIGSDTLITALPIMGSAILAAIYLRIDAIMISEILGMSELAPYAIASRIVEFTYIVPTALALSRSATIFSENNFEKRDIYLAKLYGDSLVFGIGLAAILFLIPALTLEFIFGDGFGEAAKSLRVLCLTSITVSFGVSTSQYLFATTQTNIAFYRNFIGMVINVVLNLMLIPRFGVIGAAWATVISYGAASSSIFLFHDARRHLINILLRNV